MRTYVTYLRNPEQHQNAAVTHVGIGPTRAESVADATYYANQAPWVVTVPLSRAPKWARQEAEERNGQIPAALVGCVVCGAHPRTSVRRGDASDWHCGCREVL